MQGFQLNNNVPVNLRTHRACQGIASHDYGLDEGQRMHFVHRRGQGLELEAFEGRLGDV